MEPDKKPQNRLDDLRKEWEEMPGNCKWIPWLTAGDLRLLLEHYEPLRELIRNIATNQEGRNERRGAIESGSAIIAMNQNAAVEEQRAKENWEALQRQMTALTEENATLRSRIEQNERDLSDKNAQISACQEKLSSYESENRRLEEALKKRDQQLERLQKESKPAELAALRNWLSRNPDAARRLGLQGLGDAWADLARAVAVLAQWGSIECLHEILTETAKKHGITDEEGIEILHMALTWYNYNWQKSPFRLERPSPDAAFDYNCQQRILATPTGETITRVLVPAIVDSNGKVICKAVVETR
ncbi:hypothetical protein [Tepidiphilus baoligensis]|uniref:Uncharacterized protein n=1 Tax=Tepidiphilus baoligensis TaxID=2698687 RepID=A0ABX1QK65_9PROT|nr:hypothetical protein [Tepidiphilus baoligensis]NMH16277.1 hypothetical protein [Tepidiphilus baoligensis]